MREIKFRFWDANTKVMDYDRRYIPWADEEISVDAFFDTSEGHPKSTWLQYTGLKDKNGVEIYEGDIVEIEFYDGKEIYSIIYNEHKFRYGFIDLKQDEYSFEPTGFEKMSVLGNIYKNPELLNQ